jgi:hypothetical protein
MDWIPRLLAVTSASLAFIAFGGTQADTPSPTPMLVVAPAISVPDASETPSTTTPEPPADAHCPQWWPVARDAGWTDDLLPTLDYVMWKESRCQPEVHNTTLNKDKSADVGLTQINDRSWCMGTRWYPRGYLQTIGVLSTVGCEQLFDPYLNLKAAKAIHDYALEHNGNGWQPWKL